jgi:hypothetical protein
MKNALTCESRLDNYIQIDFLYWEDCPSHERALQMLREVIAEGGVPTEVRIVEVVTEEDAERLHFPGSPTIRIAGKDIAGEGDGPYSLTCRAFLHPNGRISPLPPREQIAEALRTAAAVS